MNVATFANRVTNILGVNAATANSASSNEYTLFLSYLNEAVEQFLVETKAHLRTASLSLTADVGDYEWDTSILALKDVWIASSTQSTSATLEQVDTEEIIALRLYSGADSSWGPSKYAIQGGNLIQLWPNPGSGDTLHILYVPRPGNALAATGDTPSATAYGGVPAEFHPVLEQYVLWKMAQVSDHDASKNGEVYMQSWMAGVAQARDRMFKKAGMRTARAKIGRRRVPAVWEPGRDYPGR